jgi:hypothetical protein
MFVEDLVRNLNEIDSLKEHVDISNPIVTDDKKRLFWAMLSACLCFNWICEFDSDAKKRFLNETSFDFPALYDTLAKNRDSFDLNRDVVREFTSRLNQIRVFFG